MLDARGGDEFRTTEGFDAGSAGSRLPLWCDFFGGRVHVDIETRSDRPFHGDAVGILHAEAAAMTTSGAEPVAFVAPHPARVPLVGDPEAMAMRLVTQDNEALWLLAKYWSIVQEESAE
jgi:hypothetical protein